MAFVHPRSLPGAAWPTVLPPEASPVWAAFQTLERTQWLSAAELEGLQLRQLRELVRHCLAEVPYYTRLLNEAGLASRPIDSLAEYRKLPILTRQLYQTHSEDLRARHLPTGTTEVGNAFTSGTNGVPIKVIQTNRGALWWQAFYLRDLEWSGMDTRKRLAAIRLLTLKREELPVFLEGVSGPTWNAHCGALLKNGPGYGMDVRQDPRLQLKWLERIAPDYLLSMPTNLDVLASLLRESGRRIPALSLIQAIGESLPPDVRQRIEAGFGVPVRDLYSTTEGGYMASQCPMGGGMHVHSENILAEVLDDDGQPCRPGETGRLVFTTLHNFMAPFLRYEILDTVTVAPGPCPCGRGLPLWTRVDGRRHPVIHLHDGRRKSSIGLIPAVRKVGGLHQFQVIQRAMDHVVVRVVPDRTWTPEHATQIRQAIQAEFEAPIGVDVEELPRIERLPGGKLKIVVVEVEAGPTPP